MVAGIEGSVVWFKSGVWEAVEGKCYICDMDSGGGMEGRRNGNGGKEEWEWDGAPLCDY